MPVQAAEVVMVLSHYFVLPILQYANTLGLNVVEGSISITQFVRTGRHI